MHAHAMYVCCSGLSYGNLVSDIKDTEGLADDLRIDLIVNLMLAYRPIRRLPNQPVTPWGRPFTRQCILTYAEQQAVFLSINGWVGARARTTTRVYCNKRADDPTQPKKKEREFMGPVLVRCSQRINLSRPLDSAMKDGEVAGIHAFGRSSIEEGREHSTLLCRFL